jgi:hypothetical protein
LERNAEKEAFWMFLERKSEENGKVSIFLAGTIPDGVTNSLVTASRVTKGVDVEDFRDGLKSFVHRV